MRAAILAIPAAGAVDGLALTALCDAISTTVVAHIVANAVVAGTGGGPAPVVGTIT